MSDRSLPFTIRVAVPDDAESIAELVNLLADFEQLTQINHATAERIRAELEDPSGVLEVILAEADIDGQRLVLGMAAFFTTYSTFAAKRGLYLEDIIVKPAYRGRGVGSGLMRYLAQIARERDFGRMEWTTLLWNTDAIEFYEALGATPNDAWTSYRLIDDGLANLAATAAATARAKKT